MIVVLSALVLTAHLLSMNLATAGPLLVAYLHWRWSEPAERAGLAAELTQLSAWAVVVGVLLGAGQLLLAWSDHGPLLEQAFGLLPARRYWFGLAELAFSWGCLAAFRRVLGSPLLVGQRRSAWWGLLPFAAGTNLAYHFPPLFTLLAVYATRPASWGTPLSFVEALADAEIAAHWLHFLGASATVAGLAWASLSARRLRTPADAQPSTLAGGRLALLATILQLISGLHLLTVVDDRARDVLLGGDWLGSSSFAAALVGTVVLLHRLAAIALAETSLPELRRTWLILGTVVLCMVVALQASRRVIHRQLSAATRQPCAESHNDTELRLACCYEDFHGARVDRVA